VGRQSRNSGRDCATASVAQPEKLSRDGAFDLLALLTDYFSTLRKYVPQRITPIASIAAKGLVCAAFEAISAEPTGVIQAIEVRKANANPSAAAGAETWHREIAIVNRLSMYPFGLERTLHLSARLDRNSGPSRRWLNQNDMAGQRGKLLRQGGNNGPRV
jgi:hypothetical protein